MTALYCEDAGVAEINATDTVVSRALQARGYSPVVWDHYRHPRHVGQLDAYSGQVGTGEAGAEHDGALVRIQLQTDSSGTIVAARFKAYGCGVTIAAASWVSEWLHGKPLAQAQVLHSNDIVQALALPPVKMYCAMLVEDAVQAALNDLQNKQE